MRTLLNAIAGFVLTLIFLAGLLTLGAALTINHFSAPPATTTTTLAVCRLAPCVP